MSVPKTQGSPKISSPKKSIAVLCFTTDSAQSNSNAIKPVMVKCSCHQINNAVKKAQKRQQKAQK